MVTVFNMEFYIKCILLLLDFSFPFVFNKIQWLQLIFDYAIIAAASVHSYVFITQSSYYFTGFAFFGINNISWNTRVEHIDRRREWCVDWKGVRWHMFYSGSHTVLIKNVNGRFIFGDICDRFGDISIKYRQNSC